MEIERLESSLREKTRENRRLQENFNTLKSGNDVLRKEVGGYSIVGVTLRVACMCVSLIHMTYFSNGQF